MRKRFLWPALAWSLLIAYLCLSKIQSLPEVNIEIWGFDKIGHFVLHLVFTLLWGLHFRRAKFTRPILAAALLSLIYGALLELLQHLFTDSRQADFTDVIANTAGSVAAFLILSAYEKRLKE